MFGLEIRFGHSSKPVRLFMVGLVSIDVFSIGAGKLDRRQPRHEDCCKARGAGTVEEVGLGRDDKVPIVIPASDLLRDAAPVHGAGWRPAIAKLWLGEDGHPGLIVSRQDADQEGRNADPQACQDVRTGVCRSRARTAVETFTL
jgi:hypothetical protein